MKFIPNCRSRYFFYLSAVGLLMHGCTSIPMGETGLDGPGNVSRAMQGRTESVRDLPKSARGNNPIYTVFGRQYQVMDSAEDFREQGVASWYGRKFHGRLTSSGDVYDMHALTAAHKNLPLPTFVRVTNLANQRSIVVKVNDRGPFIDGRVIDLSYAAAAQLDILAHGTAEVDIVSLTSHVVELDTGKVSAQAPVNTVVYIQIGAFRRSLNAESLLTQIAGFTALPALIEYNVLESLYRVRIGPLTDEPALSNTLAELESAGIESYTMVTAER